MPSTGPGHDVRHSSLLDPGRTCLATKASRNRALAIEKHRFVDGNKATQLRAVCSSRPFSQLEVTLASAERGRPAAECGEAARPCSEEYAVKMSAASGLSAPSTSGLASSSASHASPHWQPWDVRLSTCECAGSRSRALEAGRTLGRRRQRGQPALVRPDVALLLVLKYKVRAAHVVQYIPDVDELFGHGRRSVRPVAARRTQHAAGSAALDRRHAGTEAARRGGLAAGARKRCRPAGAAACKT